MQEKALRLLPEQGSATYEIASAVQQAATGTQEVSSNIASVTEVAGASLKTSDELRDFVDSFLENICAA